MAKTALYHLNGRPPTLVYIVGEKDGLLDLSEAEDGEPFCTSCPVSDSPLEGHATIPAAAPKSDAKK
jgi:hypothetical protein